MTIFWIVVVLAIIVAYRLQHQISELEDRVSELEGTVAELESNADDDTGYEEDFGSYGDESST